MSEKSKMKEEEVEGEEDEGNEVKEEVSEESMEEIQKNLQRIEVYLRLFKKQKRDYDNPSKLFRDENVFYVDINQKIHDKIFHDSGRVKPYKDYSWKVNEPQDEVYETTVSDPEEDVVLRNFLDRLKQEYSTYVNIKTENYRSKDEYYQVILEITRKLIKEVSTFFGGISDDIEKRKELERKCESEIERIKTKKKSNLVFLGELKGNGICRHRSILFKLCCDVFGIPCRILRGWVYYEKKEKLPGGLGLVMTVLEKGDHMWNEIVLDKPEKHIYTVDCTHFNDLFDKSEHISPYRNLGHPLNPIAKNDKTVELLRESYNKRHKKPIGKGGFGIVLGIDDCDVVMSYTDEDDYETERRSLAVKEINISDIDELIMRMSDDSRSKCEKYVKKEIELMKLLKHPNIVELFGSFSSKNEFNERIAHIVMEKYDYDLNRFRKLISGEYFKGLKPIQKTIEVLILLLEILKGLSYIHSFGLIHFDIKPQNILVNWKDNQISEVRITDFGSCKQNNFHYLMTTLPAITHGYTAPEVLELTKKQSQEENPGYFGGFMNYVGGVFERFYSNQPTLFSTNCDIYSFGILMKSFEQFYSQFEELVEIQQKCLSKKRPKVGEIIPKFVKCLEFVKKNEETKRRDLQKAKKMFRKGIEFGTNGKYLESKSHIEKCLQIRQKYLSENDLSISDCYHWIGFSKQCLHDFTSGLKDFEKCLRILKVHFPNELHQKVAKCYNQIGWMNLKLKNYPLAKQNLERSLEIRKEIFPKDHEDIGESYGNLASLYQEQKEYSKSLGFYQKFLEIEIKKYSENHEFVAITYNNMGILYLQMKDFSSSLKFYQKSLEIFQRVLPENHPKIADCYHNMGYLYRKHLGDVEKGLEYYKKSLEIRLTSLPHDHPNVIMSLRNIGICYEFDIKDYSKALEYYKKGGKKLQEHVDRVKRKIEDSSDEETTTTTTDDDEDDSETSESEDDEEIL